MNTATVKPPIAPLKVPYYSQRDNIEEWWRTCNTSSCAMAAAFLNPGCISGDDEYKNIVDKFGDTTEHSAQTQALLTLGIDSVFHYKLDYRDLDESLESRKPAVIAVMHRGTLQAPAGGHVLVVIGRYSKGYICHDPWGKPFAYADHDGANCEIPYQSLDRRWLVDGPFSGWGRIFE